MMTIRFISGALTATIASTVLFAGLPANLNPAQAASFDSISRIYAYGDSYADNGASLSISTQAVEAGVPNASLLPADPSLGLYDAEGRWTNGLTSVEGLAQNLGVGLTNYAVGGAKSDRGNFFGWLDSFQDTGVFGQIEQFAAAQAGQPADADGLYYIFASANDFFGYLDNPNSSGTLDELAAQTVENIVQSVTQLSDLGAEQFLVVNSSDLAALPGATEFDIIEGSERFTTRVNELLPAELNELSQQLEAVEIALYDHVSISDEIRTNPQAYGLTNIDDPCQPVFPPEPVCSNPNSYYFWDENHPTGRVNHIIAEDMAEFVTTQQSERSPESVPEPSAIIGTLCLVGLLCILSVGKTSRALR